MHDARIILSSIPVLHYNRLQFDSNISKNCRDQLRAEMFSERRVIARPGRGDRVSPLLAQSIPPCLPQNIFPNPATSHRALETACSRSQ